MRSERHLWKKQVKRETTNENLPVKKKVRNRGGKESRGARGRCKRVFNLYCILN